MTKIKTGAAALAAIAVLSSCSNDDPAATPKAENDEPTTGSPTTGAAAECQPLAGSDHTALAPGCWAIQLDGSASSPRAELDLPAGFNGSDFGIWNNPTKPEEWGTIALRTGGDVHPDPCRRAGNPPTVGQRVEDLTTALAAQKVTDTTAPVPVEVDGHDGLYVELSVPAAFDISGCRDQELIVWQGPGGETPGIDHEYVSRYWVLDVDGQRVVLVVNTHPKATEETVQLFSGIVESATFAEG
jgi:hypothetical protein